MRKGLFVRIVAVLLVVSVGWLASGCFGKFQLTRKLYEVNKSVEDKYLRSAVTWLFIIPYGFTTFLDFVIFNVIEFWSGENPIASVPVTKVYAKGQDKAVMTLARVTGATVATIEKYEAGRLVSTLTVRDEGKGLVTADLREGAVKKQVFAVAWPDGSVEVSSVSPSGRERTVYAPSAVETAMARVARAAASAGGWLAGGPGAAPLAVSPRLPAFQG